MNSDGGDKGLVLLAAGGTGGHLFPAQALAEVLVGRGYRVDLVTDRRGDRYDSDFPGRAVHVVPAATARGGPLGYLRALPVLAAGIWKAWRLIGRLRPKVVAGFGGYPTLPPLLAAWLRRTRTLVHDQGAVIGRANRLLADRVDTIATSFPKMNLLDPRHAGKVIHTGAPVRASVVAAAAPYVPPAPGDEIRLLVFGGSQGARVFSDVVPAALEELESGLRRRISVVQQCRAEDMERVGAAYEAAAIPCELHTFFSDLPSRIAAAHLVIGRAGAGTVAELAVIGRPGLLVPLPHAVDNDQFLNASALVEASGGWMIDQTEFTSDRLAELLTDLLKAPETLAAAAAAVRRIGNPNAAEALADAVEALAGVPRKMAPEKVTP